MDDFELAVFSQFVLYIVLIYATAAMEGYRSRLEITTMSLCDSMRGGGSWKACGRR
jgi:hypothetical protein